MNTFTGTVAVMIIGSQNFDFMMYKPLPSPHWGNVRARNKMDGKLRMRKGRVKREKKVLDGVCGRVSPRNAHYPISI